MIDGYGEEVTADGEKYTGQWSNGYKHGKGTWKFADGSWYDGMLSYEVRHG